MAKYKQTCAVCNISFSSRQKGSLCIYQRFRTWRGSMKAWKKSFGSITPTKKKVWICPFCARDETIISKKLLNIIETKSEIVGL